METIKEIKTIHLELEKGGKYRISINGGGTNEVKFKVPADNYRQWARIFTRMAMEMWASMDAALNQEEGRK